LIGAPFVTPFLSAVLIAGGLKTSLAVGSQIKYQVKSYYHWATERNFNTNPHSAPQLNPIYSCLTSILARPLSGAVILSIAQWHEFKYTLQDANTYFNPSDLLDPIPQTTGHIAHQTSKYLRLLGAGGFATAALLSVFPLSYALLDETFCVQTPKIFSWLYPLIKNGPTESKTASSESSHSDSSSLKRSRPTWLVNSAKPLAYAINGAGGLFLNNIFCTAWAVSYLAQIPFKQAESCLSHPSLYLDDTGIQSGELARYLTGLPGYIFGTAIAFAFVHQWTMGADFISKSYSYSCGSKSNPDSNLDSELYPLCSITGLVSRILGLPGITLGAALSMPALAYLIATKGCFAISFTCEKTSQAIQAVFQAAASHVSQYHHWSTQRIAPEFPRLNPVHSCVTHLIASPFSGLTIGIMAQWYAAKHTLQDAHQTFSPNTPLENIGHIPDQSKKCLRILGVAGYATGALLSVFPLGYALLDEIFCIQTPKNISWLYQLILARETSSPADQPGQPGQTNQIIPRPCLIKAAAFPFAAFISGFSAFFMSNFHAAVWAFNHLASASFKNNQLTAEESHPKFKALELVRYLTGLPGYAIGFSVAGVVHQFIMLGDVTHQTYKKIGCCPDQTADQTADPAAISIYPMRSIPGLISRVLGLPGVGLGLAISTPALAYLAIKNTYFAVTAVFQAAVFQASIYHHWATNREHDLHSPSAIVPTNQEPLLAAALPSSPVNENYGTRTSAPEFIPSAPHLNFVSPPAGETGPKMESRDREGVVVAPNLTPKKTHTCLTHIIASPFSGSAILLMAQWYGFKHLSQDIFNNLSPNLALENTGHSQNQYYKPLRLLSLPGYSAAALLSVFSLSFAYIHEALWLQVPKLTQWFHGLISQPGYEFMTEDSTRPHRADLFRTLAIWTLALPISATLGLIINNAYCAYWTVTKLMDLPFKTSVLEPEDLHPEFKVSEVLRYLTGAPGYLLGLSLAGLWHQWTVFADTVQHAYGCDISADNQLHSLTSLSGLISRALGLPGVALGLAISSPAFIYHATLFSCAVIKKMTQALENTWSNTYQWIRSRPESQLEIRTDYQDPEAQQSSEKTSELETRRCTITQSVSQCSLYTVLAVPLGITALSALSLGSLFNFTEASADLLFTHQDSQNSPSRKSSQHLAGLFSGGYALGLVPALLILPFALAYQTYQHWDAVKDILMTGAYLTLSTALMSAHKLALKPLRSFIFSPIFQTNQIQRLSSLASLVCLGAGIYAGAHIHTHASLALLPILGGALGMIFRTCVKHYFDFKTRFLNQDQDQSANSLHLYDQAFRSLFNTFSAGDKLPDISTSGFAQTGPTRLLNQNLCTKILRNFIQIPTGLAHQSEDKNLAKGLHNAWLAWKKDSQVAQNPSMAMSVFVKTPLFKTNLERVRNTYSHKPAQEQAGFLARVDNALNTLAFYMDLDAQPTPASSQPSAPLESQYGSEQFRADIKEVITGVAMAA